MALGSMIPLDFERVLPIFRIYRVEFERLG